MGMPSLNIDPDEEPYQQPYRTPQNEKKVRLSNMFNNINSMNRTVKDANFEIVDVHK